MARNIEIKARVADRAALEALPGVGRKTANVVLNEAFVAGWGPVPEMGLARTALATSIIATQCSTNSLLGAPAFVGFVLGGGLLWLQYELAVPLAMLALSSAIYMLALATSQAVLALHGHAHVALGWALGVVGFFLGTWLSSDLLFRRIEIGLVVSALVPLGWFALTLRRQLAAVG